MSFTMTDLAHWRTVEKISVAQAGFLMAGIDPFDLDHVESRYVAQGKTFELAIRQAGERAFKYAWDLVHRLDEFPHHPSLADIWEQSGDFERYLPSIELRASVAEVLRDPENVPLLLPSDPWFSETVYGAEMVRWIQANDINVGYVFPEGQAVVVRDRGTASWADWREDRDAQEQRETTHQRATKGAWPWGDHDTALLRKLAAAAERFWVNYDPSDATTAPTNAQVVTWLKAQGVAERTAEIMASILRIDGLPTGPRR